MEEKELLEHSVDFITEISGNSTSEIVLNALKTAAVTDMNADIGGQVHGFLNEKAGPTGSESIDADNTFTLLDDLLNLSARFLEVGIIYFSKKIKGEL